MGRSFLLSSLCFLTSGDLDHASYTNWSAHVGCLWSLSYVYYCPGGGDIVGSINLLQTGNDKGMTLLTGFWLSRVIVVHVSAWTKSRPDHISDHCASQHHWAVTLLRRQVFKAARFQAWPYICKGYVLLGIYKNGNKLVRLLRTMVTSTARIHKSDTTRASSQLLLAGVKCCSRGDSTWNG